MMKLLGIIAVVGTCCFAASVDLWNVETCQGECPEIDHPDRIVLLASTQCQLYCKCVGGRPVPHECRNKWYFDVDAGTCLPTGESECSSDKQGINF